MKVTSKRTDHDAQEGRPPHPFSAAGLLKFVTILRLPGQEFGQI